MAATATARPGRPIAGGVGAWLPAVRLGWGALGIGLAIQYGFGVVIGLIQALSGAGIDWGATLRAPLTVFLSLHGPVGGLGLWATGVGWIALSFWLAGRGPGTERAVSWSARLVMALQSAVVYIVPVLLVAIAVDPEALPVDLTVGVAGAFFDPAAYGAWNPWAVATLGSLAALVGASASVLGRRGLSGAGARMPGPVLAGFAGMRVLLATAIPAVLAVVVVGVFIEVMAGGLGIALGAAYLLTLLLAAFAWGGLDVGVAFMVFSMRFFGGDGFVVLGERPAWVFVCIAVVAVAYLRGGYRAARETGPATIGRAALAAAVAGVMTAFVLMIGAALNTGTVPDLAGPAFGLGLLWSAVAVAGGLWQAGFRPRLGGASPPPPSASARPPAQTTQRVPKRSSKLGAAPGAVSNVDVGGDGAASVGVTFSSGVALAASAGAMSGGLGASKADSETSLDFAPGAVAPDMS
ncbi:MAG: hypothetical protein MUP76_05390 [Acidimicrobiia bacterium]|nr:hypothetical protein [Acidimicrobiia bacterium]